MAKKSGTTTRTTTPKDERAVKLVRSLGLSDLSKFCTSLRDAEPDVAEYVRTHLGGDEA